MFLNFCGNLDLYIPRPCDADIETFSLIFQQSANLVSVLPQISEKIVTALADTMETALATKSVVPIEIPVVDVWSQEDGQK